MTNTLDTLIDMVKVTAEAVKQHNHDPDTAVHLTRHFIGHTADGLSGKDRVEYFEAIAELMQNTLRSLYRKLQP